MKPRVLLEKFTSDSGVELALYEHDGRIQLSRDGETVAGPPTHAGEMALARTALLPFRGARQPRVWIGGLGLGTMVETACEVLPQQRASFVVAEPFVDLPEWLRRHGLGGALEDERVQVEAETGLARQAGSYHALLLHAAVSPRMESGQTMGEDARWLAGAYEALRQGGLLALVAPRRVGGLAARLHGQGFDVSIEEISAPPQRKPLLLFLARKGKYKPQSRRDRKT